MADFKVIRRVVELVFDRRKGLIAQREAEKNVGAIDKALGTLKKAAIAAGAAIAARLSVRLVKSLFELGTAVEETASKFAVTFGAAAGEVDAFINDFGRLAGLSRQQGRELTATTGAVAQGLGLAREESAAFAIEATRLAADIASFNNAAGGTEQVLHAIRSALTGEREALKTFGIAVREVDVQQKALTQTGKTHIDQLTAAERATATLTLVTERAGVAIGDLERTQDSAANRARQLAADLKNIRDTVATAVLPVMSTALEIINENAESFVSLEDHIKSAGESIREFMVRNRDALSTAFRAARDFIGFLAKSITGLFILYEKLVSLNDKLAAAVQRAGEIVVFWRRRAAEETDKAKLSTEEWSALLDKRDEANAAKAAAQRAQKEREAAEERKKAEEQAAKAAEAANDARAKQIKLLAEGAQIQGLLTKQEVAQLDTLHAQLTAERQTNTELERRLEIEKQLVQVTKARRDLADRERFEQLTAGMQPPEPRVVGERMPGAAPRSLRFRDLGERPEVVDRPTIARVPVMARELLPEDEIKRAQRARSIIAEVREEMTRTAEEIGDIATPAFETFFDIMIQGFRDGEGAAKSFAEGFVGLGRFIVSQLIEGFAEMEIAKGTAALAAGLWPPNPAAIASSAKHFLAAGLFKALAAQVGGGGGGAGAGAGGGAGPTQVSGGSAAVTALQDATDRAGADVFIFIDPLNPQDPAWQRNVQQTSQYARERYGNDARIIVRPRTEGERGRLPPVTGRGAVRKGT